MLYLYLRWSMSRIKKMLDHWASHQLITQKQAQKIIEYEKSQSRRSWVLYGFLTLGVVVIAMGIISLIAANWAILSNDFKLFVDFLFLISLAIGTYFVWQKNKPILFEVCLVFFMLLCLASIGLISQIYHTGGQLYEALLLWSIITSGLFVISNRLFASFVWASGFFPGISLTALNLPVLKPIFQENISVLIVMPLLSGILALIFKNINGKEKQAKVFKIWTILMGISAIIVAEVCQVDADECIRGTTSLFIIYFLVACLGCGILIDTQYKKIQKVLSMFVLILYLIPFHLLLLDIQSSTVYAIFSIFILVVTAMFFASLRQRRLFHFFLVMTGIRFLVWYFQALGGLVTTGFNLIASGIIIISMVTFWHKYHNKITLWTERLVR